MLVISGPRQSGKTDELIKMAAAKKAYLVVFSYAEAQRCQARARSLGLELLFPLTYEEFVKGDFYGKGMKGFLVDDIADLLRYMARGVEMIAYSVEE